jgi:hypothetical protein
VLYGIGNVCFVSVDDDMRSGPPFRGRDGKFHSHGTLEVVSGVLFDNFDPVEGRCVRLQRQKAHFGSTHAQVLDPLLREGEADGQCGE